MIRSLNLYERVSNVSQLLTEYCSEEDLNTPMPEPGPVQESQEVKDKEKEEEGGEDETDDGIEEENDKEEDTGSKEEL